MHVSSAIQKSLLRTCFRIISSLAFTISGAPSFVVVPGILIIPDCNLCGLSLCAKESWNTELCAEVLTGLGSAVPGSMDEDLERVMPPANAILSMTAGFLGTSPDGALDEAEETSISAAATGLRGVSVPPSTLGASSRLERPGMEILSLVATLSRLGFPERIEVGVPSTGRLKLLRPVLRLGGSSGRGGTERELSLSIMPSAVTATTAVPAGVRTALFAILARFWTLGGAVLGLDTVVIEDALDDWGWCDELAVMTPDEEVAVVGMSEETAESNVELVAPLSPRGSADEALEPAPGTVELFLETPSWFSVSSASCTVDFPTPTASLKRLYSPLRPCWTRSPAVPLASIVGRLPGGGAKSLKVVRAPDWLADVWIWSSVMASRSLSCEEIETDASESRRGRAVPGEGGVERAKEGGLGALVLAMPLSLVRRGLCSGGLLGLGEPRTRGVEGRCRASSFGSGVEFMCPGGGNKAFGPSPAAKAFRFVAQSLSDCAKDFGKGEKESNQ